MQPTRFKVHCMDASLADRRSPSKADCIKFLQARGVGCSSSCCCQAMLWQGHNLAHEGDQLDQAANSCYASSFTLFRQAAPLQLQLLPLHPTAVELHETRMTTVVSCLTHFDNLSSSDSILANSTCHASAAGLCSAAGNVAPSSMLSSSVCCNSFKYLWFDLCVRGRWN